MLFDHLVEQQVLAHGARARHADEELAERKGPKMNPRERGELAEQFQALHLEHDLICDYLDERKQVQKACTEQIRREAAGPMFIWEVIADRLSRLVA